MHTRTPDTTQEGVDQEDDRPPVVPEEADAKVASGVLRAPQQQGHVGRVDPDCEAMVDLLRPPITAQDLLQLWQALEQVEAQPVLDLQSR